MTRSDILTAAAACVTQDRNNTYGPPEDSFAVIASYWSTYLGVPLGAAQVGTLLALMKIARMQANPGHVDSYVDGAGYLACAGGIATADAPTPLYWHPEPKVVSFVAGQHTWLLEEKDDGFRLHQEGRDTFWRFGSREDAVAFAERWEKPDPVAEMVAALRNAQSSQQHYTGHTLCNQCGYVHWMHGTCAIEPICADEEPLT